jgi:hypothetical protein
MESSIVWTSHKDVNSGNKDKEERNIIVFTITVRRLCFDGVTFIIFGVKQHSFAKVHIQLSWIGEWNFLSVGKHQAVHL